MDVTILKYVWQLTATVQSCLYLSVQLMKCFYRVKVFKVRYALNHVSYILLMDVCNRFCLIYRCCRTFPDVNQYIVYFFAYLHRKWNEIKTYFMSFHSQEFFFRKLRLLKQHNFYLLLQFYKRLLHWIEEKMTECT